MFAVGNRLCVGEPERDSNRIFDEGVVTGCSPSVEELEIFTDVL